jgi:hypothetical protein
MIGRVIDAAVKMAERVSFLHLFGHQFGVLTSFQDPI